MSLIPIGMPCSGPRSRPACSSASRSRACDAAPSRSTRTQARTSCVPLVDAVEARRRTSTQVISPGPQPPGGAGDRLVVVGEELHRSSLPGRCSVAGLVSGWNLLENPVARPAWRSPGGTRSGWSARTGGGPRLVDAVRPPRLALAEVLDERLAGDPRQVGHGHGLDGPAGREADERPLEHPGDQRRRRLDEPELEHRLDHLRRQAADLAGRSAPRRAPGPARRSCRAAPHPRPGCRARESGWRRPCRR